MQKKIVAGICAAALALAMPAAAFADFMSVNASAGTASLDKVESGKVTLTDINVTNASDVYEISIKGNGEVAAPASNAIPGSGASFTITAKTKKENATKGLGVGSIMTAKAEFKSEIVNNLPDTVALDNLYIAGTYKSDLQGATVPMTAVKLAAGLNNAPGSAQISATAGGKIELENLGAGTLTIWMQNGAVTRDGASDAANVADEAKDGSKSPKTGELL